eukprot:CAMPEP_0198287476 /NCGR_PEP_ID=MMETSP1449-20131203/6275_1 /TAXON_ID=420275 /ORGANISM="Attheya septentrionalis, Strain CCMP2084" /LENGTH=502 /DNA_ID=CAMNT_0043985435 /DNA_START=83 /DNA_END=1591 /DNA_ORIENTATION=+
MDEKHEEGAGDDEICEDLIQARYVAECQGHVLKHLPSLEEAKKKELLRQLKSIKVETVASTLFSALQTSQSETQAKVVPFSGHVARVSSSDNKSEDDEAWMDSSRRMGLEAIAKGKVAAVVLSGGQGTRLGFDGPKGMYDIGTRSGKSLFELVANRLKCLSRLAATAQMGTQTSEPSSSSAYTIPWYIMTSPLNHEGTVEYFESQKYFGLPPSSVHLFQQGMLPCVTEEGKLIMDTKHSIAMAPDGNGGIYPSLEKSGMLHDMERRGIEYMHVFSIDNALVKPADPLFVGYCISQGADCGNKVLWKSGPHEKVGVIAQSKETGKPCIVEYSDLDTGMAEQLDDSGRLAFGAGNICNHFYTVDFIRNVVLTQMDDMYHVARKKIPYYDETSDSTLQPTSNNGIKLETFIFDVFPLSSKMAVLDVVREEEFAPVKNAPGAATDSPDTARKLLSDLAKTWVQASGGTLVGNVDSDMCEISPLTSYSGEGLTDLVSGKEITCPFSL